MIYKIDKALRKKLIPIFADMGDTMILSCIQGHMGEAYVDNIDNPTAALLIVGAFVFLSGDVNSEIAEELLLNIPKNSLVIVDTDEWKSKIEKVYNGRYEKFDRYSFKKDIRYLDYNYIKD